MNFKDLTQLEKIKVFIAFGILISFLTPWWSASYNTNISAMGQQFGGSGSINVSGYQMNMSFIGILSAIATIYFIIQKKSYSFFGVLICVLYAFNLYYSIIGSNKFDVSQNYGALGNSSVTAGYGFGFYLYCVFCLISLLLELATADFSAILRTADSSNSSRNKIESQNENMQSDTNNSHSNDTFIQIPLENPKKINKNILVFLVVCVIAGGGGYFAYSKYKKDVIPTTAVSLWDIIVEFKENKANAIKYKGKTIQITGWLNTKDLSPEGDVLIEIRGATNKNGQYYLMSAGAADKPANDYTGYNGVAECKLVGDIETLKKFDEEKGYLQEVTIEGTINNIEENSREVAFFDRYLTVKSFVVSLSNGKVINVKNLTTFKSKVQVVQSETSKKQTTEQTPTKIETSDFSSLIGEWKGAFGNDQLALTIETVNEDGSVTGFNIVKNNRRNLTGFARNNEFELNEPGDDKWDGVFKFSIAEGILKGTWISNNGKSRKEFSLSK